MIESILNHYVFTVTVEQIKVSLLNKSITMTCWPQTFEWKYAL